MSNYVFISREENEKKISISRKFCLLLTLFVSTEKETITNIEIEWKPTWVHVLRQRKVFVLFDCQGKRRNKDARDAIDVIITDALRQFPPQKIEYRFNACRAILFPNLFFVYCVSLRFGLVFILHKRYSDSVLGDFRSSVYRRILRRKYTSHLFLRLKHRKLMTYYRIFTGEECVYVPLPFQLFETNLPFTN